MLPVLTVEQWEASQRKCLDRWRNQAQNHELRRQEELRVDAILRRFRISGLAGIVVETKDGPFPAIETVGGNFLGIVIDPLIPDMDRKMINGWKSLSRGATLEETKLPAASVHHVLCINALGRARNVEQTLTEFVRILKPGGKLWLYFEIPASGLDYHGINEFLGRLLEVEQGEIVDQTEGKTWYGVYRKIGK